MGLEEVGQEIHSELTTIATWFSTGSPRHLKVQSLLIKLEDAGVTPTSVNADDVERLATPGPGVRSATVQVDSVGEVEDTAPDPAEQRRVAAAAAAEAAKKQAEENKQSTS